MAKGRKTGGGSRKGCPNKISGRVKEMVEGALQDLGGRAWLKKQAERNPVAFMALLGRVMPLQEGLGVSDGPILIVTGITRPDDGINPHAPQLGQSTPQLGQSTAEPIDVTPSSSKLTR